MAKNNFEEKMKIAKELLDKLMDPSLSLEEGMKFYKQGMKELNSANELLEKAKLEYKEVL